MKNVLWAVSCLCTVGCGGSESVGKHDGGRDDGGGAGRVEVVACAKDTDCKGDRVCTGGACVGPPVTPPDASTNPGDGGASGDGGPIDGGDTATDAGSESTKPVVIASTPGRIALLAAGADALYWLEDAGGGDCGTLIAVLKKIPFAGGSLKTIAQISGICPVDFAVNATDAYTRDIAGKVLRVPLDGSADVVVAQGEGWSSTERGGVALDKTSVYWSRGAVFDETPLGLRVPVTPGAILRAPLKGGPAETLALLPADIVPAGADAGSGDLSAVSANDLVVDASHVYYTADDGTVMRVAKTGGVPEEIATNQSDPWALAVDAETVYWNAGAGKVMSVSKSGGTPKVLSKLAVVDTSAIRYPPPPLALDGASLYWTNAALGEVFRVPTAGGPTKQIASDAPSGASGAWIVWPIAVGPERAYWASGMNIMSVPK